MPTQGIRKRTLASTIVSIVIALLLLPFNNCGSSHDPGNTLPSLTEGEILAGLQVQSASVFGSRCSECHNENVVDPNNNLRSFDIDDLEGNGFVDVGAPQESWLYLRIIDGTMPPPPEAALTDSELAYIRDWIAAEGGVFNTYIGGAPVEGSGPANFNQVRQVLARNCNNCHEQGANPPRLDVDANTIRNTFFGGQNLVIPGNADASRLLNSFNRMPPGAPIGANSPEANIIRSWIEGGAQ